MAVFFFGSRINTIHCLWTDLSQWVQRHPGLQVRLEVFDRLADVAGEGFDLDVRVGDDIAPHLIARRLADNHRVLCAAPAYLKRRGAHAGRAAGARLPGDQGARSPLRCLAPALRRPGAGGEGTRPALGQPRRDGSAVGRGWAWHRAALVVGRGATAARRLACAGAAQMAPGGQYLGRVPHAAGALGQGAGVRGVLAGGLSAERPVPVVGLRLEVWVRGCPLGDG